MSEDHSIHVLARLETSHAMTLEVPTGAPRYRFMRYVRPPARKVGQRELKPLFPNQPDTRKLRVGIDVQTLPQLTPLLARVVTRGTEVEPILLVQNADTEPTQWKTALNCTRWYRYSFTTVEDAPRMGDSSTVGVTGFKKGKQYLSTSGHFFSVYAQLDHAAREAYSDGSGVTLADRHRAAALAAAAASIGVDVIVTASPTAGRDDVADNDLVVSLTPEQLLPLFGHYLRVTGNNVLESVSGRLRGGGTFVRNENAASIADLYLGGIDASAPHLTAIRLMAIAGGDQNLTQSMLAIAVRLSRAGRALDDLLAVLSNGGDSQTERIDTAETTGEAFERTLLYLCAAMDRYARVTRTLFDTDLDPDNQRCSLTSTGELRSVIKKFEPTDTTQLEALGSYARVIGHLRNRIHSLPLDTQHHLSRSYGSSTTVAVALSGVSELAPEHTPLRQEQLDRLGVWNAHSSSPFGPSHYTADIATLATTLFMETLQYLETFSQFIVRNKVAAHGGAHHPVLGCWADDPRPMPDAGPKELLYREMLGWADVG